MANVYILLSTQLAFRVVVLRNIHPRSNLHLKKLVHNFPSLCIILKFPFLAQIDGTYHTGGLDLNEPFTEDVIMLDDMPDKQEYGSKTGQCNKEDESNKTGNEKNATWSNASEKEAVTGETISTDESGSDDEVKSTPCSQTDVQKLYP
jgi:hypothetical protein